MTEEKKDYYWLERDNVGCATCGHEETWMIVAPDGTGLSTIYEDREHAEELCEMFNDAYKRGQYKNITAQAHSDEKQLQPVKNDDDIPEREAIGKK